MKKKITDKQLDTLCRQLVFQRDGHACRWCGKTQGIQWCHIYSRRFKRVRWDLRNSVCLCAGCHLKWHDSPIEAIKWITGNMGELELAFLQAERHVIKKIDRPEILATLEELQGLADAGVYLPGRMQS